MTFLSGFCCKVRGRVGQLALSRGYYMSLSRLGRGLLRLLGRSLTVPLTLYPGRVSGRVGCFEGLTLGAGLHSRTIGFERTGVFGRGCVNLRKVGCATYLFSSGDSLCNGSMGSGHFGIDGTVYFLSPIFVRFRRLGLVSVRSGVVALRAGNSSRCMGSSVNLSLVRVRGEFVEVGAG